MEAKNIWTELLKIVLTPLLDDSELFFRPSLTDLNVKEFAICEILARKTCEKPCTNVESLKRSLKKAWANLDEGTIHKCSANAHKRLEAVFISTIPHRISKILYLYGSYEYLTMLEGKA